MADHAVPHFHNESGVTRIRIGAKEFMCVGAKPPHDHPHIFLDMGGDEEAICPYCSTVYQYDGDFAADQTEPPNCLHHVEA